MNELCIRIVTGKKFKLGMRRWIKICFIHFLLHHQADPHMNILKQWKKYLTRFERNMTIFLSFNLWVHFFFFSFFAIPFPYFWLNLLEHFKDHEDDYEADQLGAADPLNQVLSGCQIFVFPRMAVVKNFLYC